MSLLVYTVLRILLVVAAGGLLYLAGLRGLLLVAVAVIVGALVSFLLLGGPRNQAAQTLQAWVEKEPRPTRPDADSRVEDAEIEHAGRLEDAGPADGSAEPEPERYHDRQA